MSTAKLAGGPTPENWLVFPNKFDEFTEWEQYGGVFVPVESAGDWTVPFPVAGGFYQTCDHVFPAASDVCFSLEVMSCPTGLTLGIYEGAPSFALIGELDISGLVDGVTYQRLFITVALPPGITTVVVDVGETTAAGDTLMRKAQLNAGTTPAPYM